MNKEIPVLYTPTSFLHNPPFEVFNGEKDNASESIKRIVNILGKLNRTDFANIQIAKLNGLAYVEQVHGKGYLDYLRRASNESKETGKPIYPSVHPYISNGLATNTVAERGKYVFDTYTPIMEGTFDIALDSAACAAEGAKLLSEGVPFVYALTRPPGHHAEKAMAGGYCYINNAAVAAEYLLKNVAEKVAIFDFDFHHGNGTQDIFYEREDVLVVNIHASPSEKFPYFTGYENENGSGKGEGANFNFPLPLGTGDSEFSDAVAKSLKLLRTYRPQYIVASAGFDTHEADPIGGFKVTTEYYRTLGRNISELGIPTLTVQEGGYATEVLGDNVVSYLRGLLD